MFKIFPKTRNQFLTFGHQLFTCKPELLFVTAKNHKKTLRLKALKTLVSALIVSDKTTRLLFAVKNLNV